LKHIAAKAAHDLKVSIRHHDSKEKIAELKIASLKANTAEKIVDH
jgi:hypothetical protein